MQLRKLSTAAVIGLGACAAHAQSSVTIYGVVDQYIGHTSAGGRGSVTSLDAGGVAASRLGFRGVEDLGGGLKASFTLENGILSDTGAAADATRGFNRQSWLGIGGGWGEFRFGRQNTPAFWMCGQLDAAGCATYASLLNNTSGYAPRFDNMLYYFSPDLSGFKLQGGVALGEQQAPASKSGLNAYMFGAEYKGGNFWVGLNHASQNSANNTVKAKASFLGGNWDHGNGKVYLGLHRGNMNGASMATNVQGRDYFAWSLSADWRITGTTTVGVLAGRADDRTATNNDAKQFSLIATHALSRRTQLYATATRLSNENGATFSLGAAGPITRNVPLAGQDAKGFQVGVRHTF